MPNELKDFIRDKDIRSAMYSEEENSLLYWMKKSPTIRYNTLYFADIRKALDLAQKKIRTNEESRQLAIQTHYEKDDYYNMFKRTNIHWGSSSGNSKIDQLAFEFNGQDMLLIIDPGHKALKEPNIVYIVDLTSFFLDHETSMEKSMFAFHDLLARTDIAHSKIILVFNKLDTFKARFNTRGWSSSFSDYHLNSYHYGVALAFIRTKFLFPLNALRNRANAN
eukprot:CAMPEP_0168563492 /NCGR_PEP_ID=MMETSP0413-20121227/12705_1 /TAXON_ID=136452 /ORGANISM="Filamoeba nolandi, Strain NC-AS-23-1" /LENGTH=221 /DNA_ID=CAMNT_0008595029 /DNA_START=372 /DNA_END=1037 /DNA_ORIENTATION=+